jgi:3-isopropylmalate/(R)-2-methylmalate dehydratase small subunit
MEKFIELDALVAPLDLADVNTDAIIPSKFLKSIKRTGFGKNLFDTWRYLDRGETGGDEGGRALNPEFSLNQPRYLGAQILLTRENFGCGSSREHAAWALLDYGFRAVVAPGYADIFLGNCFKNGLLPIVLDADAVGRLFDAVAATPGYRLKVNLERQTVTTPEGLTFAFRIDEFKKHCLLNGLDDIALGLRHVEKIKAYENMRRDLEPWIFADD